MANMRAALRIHDFGKLARDIVAEPIFPPLGIPAVNHLFSKGLIRGSIAEIHGRRSSGRTAFALHLLAQATLRGEICAVVDLNGVFAPGSAAAAGVILSQIVWVRCLNNIEHALRAADLLIHAGGFGIVVLDLCDATPRMLNRIPLSYWFRFRRAIENTPTNLIVSAPHPVAKSCSTATFQWQAKQFRWSGNSPARLLRGIESIATVSQTGMRPVSGSLRTVA